MEKVIENAFAKVNISLDVLGTRNDGYHEMMMINHSIALKDTLVFKRKKEGLSLFWDVKNHPVDENNLVLIGARKLQEYCNVNIGAEIYLNKRIPMEAGLGGGSSDAAATLKALNKLWDLKLTASELSEIGLSIGADVPYCLMGGTALVQGIGEKITPLLPIKKLSVVVVKPEINISTPKAFKALDGCLIRKRPDIFKVIELLEIEDYTGLQQVIGNVFEEVIFNEYPEIKKIKEGLIDQGALAGIMTGSGSTVVGYFKEKMDAIKSAEFFAKQYKMCFLSETC